MARKARKGGAEIYRETSEMGFEPLPSGEWLVKTDKGDIQCKHVIRATGNFARQTGAMVGLDIPVIQVEHQYSVTEARPEMQKRHK